MTSQHIREIIDTLIGMILEVNNEAFMDFAEFQWVLNIGFRMWYKSSNL